MPEFILQEYKHPLGRPPQRIIFTKNEYCDRVKMPGWDRVKECQPKDNNPYDPPFGNQFLSTYNRIGHMKEDENHFVSETHSFLESIKDKHKALKSDKRPMIHFLTYKEPCPPKVRNICPEGEHCAPDYSTTMKDAYRMPHDCVLKRLTAPKLPFLQTRKLTWETPDSDACKFYDDAHIPKIGNLQCIKKIYNRSYDPISNLYNDGTAPKEKIRKCNPVPFTHTK